MAWSGSNFVRALGSTQWTSDAAANVGIEAGIHDTQDNDLASGIDACLNKNGANTPTANLSMGGFKHTNVAVATADTEYSTLGQVKAYAPPGAIFDYAGTAAPTGFLLCDGTAISRVTYATLFAITSTTYGVGDGATTFNLPDLRQKFSLGKAASGTGSTLGSTGGAIDHTHTTPNHQHSAGNLRAQIGVNLADASSGIRMALDGGNTFTSGYKWSANTPTFSAETTGGHPTTVVQGNTANDGSGTSGANNPPFLVLNKIIKT